MLDRWFDTASAVAGVFLVMGVGGLARHLQWFSKEVDRSLASFTSYVLMPCLFFNRIINDASLSAHLDTWYPAALGYLCTLLGVGIAWGTARTIGSRFGIESDSEQRTFGLTAGIHNYGYIALPLAEVFYPACVVSLMIHNVGVDLALWSVGLYTISGKGLKQSWKRIVFSPPLLAVVLAVLIKRFDGVDWIPGPLEHATAKLGLCSVPMGLVLSGAILYDYFGICSWEKARRVLSLAIPVRMMILPLTILAIATWSTSSEPLKQVLLIQAAMPAATFPIVMTRLYEQDVQTAWVVVVGTSLLSLLTIPLWMIFGAAWLGLA
ncbi:MAG: AEC family transporter [Planctomycetota bacterium]|nr:AEC family transporter [Planctomycetota bacterium]